MSLSITEMNDRIASLQAFWRDRGIPLLRESSMDPAGLVVRNEDPFGPMRLYSQMQDVGNTKIMYQRAEKIMTELRNNPEFPLTLSVKGGIFDTMDAILKGEIRYQPIQRQDVRAVPGHRRAAPEKPVRLTILNRNKFHNQFMQQPGMDAGLKGLIQWLREFYCERYLKSDRKNKGKLDKAYEILECMKALPTRTGMTVQEYLTQIPAGQFESLAQIIGGNRISSSASKTPWGLQKIIDTFHYTKGAKDTSAKVAKHDEPLEIPTYKGNHFI